MPKMKPPKTKANKLANGSGTRASKSMFSGMGTSALGLAAGVVGAVGISSALSSLGLPPLGEMLSNPLYLGAAALGAWVLLK